jgi:hypothetical protein
MLTWKPAPKAKGMIAELDGQTYIISDPTIETDKWGVAFPTPDGRVDFKLCLTLEEAKQYCENTAAALQAEDG